MSIDEACRATPQMGVFQQPVKGYPCCGDYGRISKKEKENDVRHNQINNSNPLE
jgi:hypothetical protein